MHRIAVIGIGNLGMRHLESLCTMNNAGLYGVEVNQPRFHEMREKFLGQATIVQNIAELPSQLSLLVIATTADIRKTVFFEVLEHCRVENILFEKVLFQKSEDYIEVDRILKERGIKAWVNCPRREFEGYWKLKERIDTEDHFTFSYTGGEWGLGCNAIHLLDLICYLADTEACEINIDSLLPGIVESRRRGFYEFYGTINGRAGKCLGYNITCYRDSQLPGEIEVTTPGFRCIIKETENIILTEKKDNSGSDYDSVLFKQKYQSELTAIEADEILSTGSCKLTAYSESMKLHMNLISKLVTFFKENGWEDEICPIT